MGKKHKYQDIYEDCNLEITSSLKINVEKQLKGVGKAIRNL